MKLHAYADSPLPWLKAVTSNAMDIDPDFLSNDLGSVMGTGTLLAHGTVPEGFPTSSKGLAEQQLHFIGGARYLVID